MAENNYILQFEESCYKPAFAHMIKSLDNYLSENMDEIFNDFQKHIKDIFYTIEKLQEKDIIKELHNISLSVLLTSLYQKKPTIMLELYEGIPFLDTSIFSHSLPVNWLFSKWEDFYKDLEDKVSKLGLRRFIKPSMIQSYTWKGARFVIYYSTTIYKYWIRKIVKESAFNKLKLADNFFITYGEYMDWQQRIYGQQEEIDIFNCEDDTDLTYRQFKNKWYENKTFSNLCLDDSLFKNCTFVKTTFDKTKLNNVQFIDCTFQDCTFVESSLHGTTFTDTYLKNIKWKQVHIYNDERKDGIPILYGPTDLIRCMIEEFFIENTDLRDSRWQQCHVKDVQVENVSMSKDVKMMLGLKEEEN